MVTHPQRARAITFAVLALWSSRASSARADETPRPELVIKVPESSRLADLIVRCDGAELPAAEWGVSIPREVGSHVVEASAPGYRAFRTTIALDTTNAEVTTIVVPLLLEERRGHDDLREAKRPRAFRKGEIGGAAMFLSGIATTGFGLVLGISAVASYGDRGSFDPPQSATGGLVGASIGILVAGAGLIVGGVFLSSRSD